MNTAPIRSMNRFGSRRLTLLILAGLLVFFTASSAMAADILIQPRLAPKLPKIDGVVSAGEWDGARLTYLPSPTTRKFSVMRTMNDARYLYILLDALSDTGNDRTGVLSDYYVLAFDADLNHRVTPREDLIYSACQDGREFVKAYYLSSSSWTTCMTPSRGSAGKYGFGATLHSATPHRFYEFRILLSEIGADPSRWMKSFGGLPSVRLNVTIRSGTPKISYSYPTNYPWPDMAGNMFLIQLAPSSSLPVTGDIFAGVGLIPAVPYIDNLGYANINTAYFTAVDSPFGGSLSTFGNWNDLRSYGGAKYKIKYARREGGAAGYLIQTWTNYRYNSISHNWDPVAIGTVDAAGRYAIPPVSETWYYSNLLINWQTANPLFPDGTYDLSLELFNAAGNPITIPPAVKNGLTLYVVNTPPRVKINRILYNGVQVGACEIVNQGAAPTGFTFDVSVTDGKGALDKYYLTGFYGDNQNSPVFNDAYSPGHLDADGANKWNGVTNHIVPTGAAWRAPSSCGYTFILWASSRVLNGYAWVFPYVDYKVSLTILTTPIIGASTGETGEKGCASCEEAAPGSAVGCRPSGM